MRVFGERRRSYHERSAQDMSLGMHGVAVMAGPEVAPESVFTEEHRKRVLGADVCGEYSPPHHANWFKRIESRMDQPVRNAANQRRIDANTRTDCELARVLYAACSTAP